MPLKERISAFDGLDITPEQREILEAIREFVDREVIPVAKELEARDEFPTKIVEGLRDMGAFGMRIPAEYGGLGLDLVTYALVIAELTRGWMAVSGIVNGQYIVSGMIGAHGTDEQKQNYLPRLAVGEIRSCFSMTEPDAGSDVQAIRTIARREGDEFVIDGNKMWVTNGDRASLIALLVKTDPDADPRHTGMTALLVEKEALVAQQNGLTVSPPLGKLGYHGVESVEFAFEEFRVPVSAVLGGEEMIGKGFYQMMSGIETGRINVAARGLGISLRALELSLEYAQQRSAFGKPIGHHQLIQKKIADMATRIEASKHLILAAAKKKDSGQRADIEAGMAKLYATETCQRCAEEAMRIFGGYGYSTEYEVERLYRDAPLMMIGEGTNEIQETIIAKGLLKRHELI
ncbi:MAG: acyl-CoA dehydrogenase [Thermoleophilia bacterium]|nr:MAG: acyl-CoA dehydrogenase [Thermoleophilia bacterium]